MTLSYPLDNIPSLHTANRTFHSKDGPRFVDEQLKPLLIENGVAGKFGAGLVHCHSHLTQGEGMVEFNGTSTPWLLGKPRTLGGDVIPIAWSLTDGALLPYEWRFVPYGAELPEELDQTTSWVKSFIKLVNDSGLSGSLGLRRAPEGGKECLEISRGSANIMIPSDQVSR